MSRACCPSVTGNLLLQTVIAIPGSQSSETHKVWGLSSPIVSPSGCSIFLVRYGGVLCTIHASFQYIQQGRNVLVRKRPRHFSSRLPGPVLHDPRASKSKSKSKICETRTHNLWDLSIPKESYLDLCLKCLSREKERIGMWRPLCSACPRMVACGGDVSNPGRTPRNCWQRKWCKGG